MAEVGRKTILDKELFGKIKQSIIDGNDLRTTAKVCDIVESTLYMWHSDNYLNLADKIEVWKHERMLRLAEMNLEAILCLGISDKDSLKIVQDTAKFVSETLGKKSYSKQVNTDITTNGKDLPTPLLANLNIDAISDNNSNEEDNQPEEED
jgi:hypothetical protein